MQLPLGAAHRLGSSSFPNLPAQTLLDSTTKGQSKDARFVSKDAAHQILQQTVQRMRFVMQNKNQLASKQEYVARFCTPKTLVGVGTREVLGQWLSEHHLGLFQ